MLEPSIPLLTPPPPPAWLEASRRPFHADMYALYSSAWGGIVTDPLYMQVPVDDHLVHRGDGVFETLKCVGGRIYCLAEHLERLRFSSGRIGLTAPCDDAELGRRIIATLRAAGRRDALVRVILSRGPGGMGINPYECPTPHLYILVHKLFPPFMTIHPGGAHLVTCDIPVKAGLFATIKTCNYLPNALMKKEAVDRGADFAVNVDEQGHIAEGATENIGLVTTGGVLWIPRPERILNGTTMNRAWVLADRGLAEGWLSGKERRAFGIDDLAGAAEILVFGTTTNVTAVTRLDRQPVSGGTPGPVQARLNALLLDEQSSDNPFTTHAFA